jgi:hypothetical protein
MKLKEITPEHLRCVVGACPAVYETDRGTYVLIGKIVNDVNIANLLAGKVGADEMVVEIPKEFLSSLAI